MPKIYDNTELILLDGLRDVMADAQAADMCVGYFNLRGWEYVADLIEPLEGTDEHCCRLLVGMQKPPEAQMREAYKAIRKDEYLDPPTISRLKYTAAESFRGQLAFGVPSNAAELALQRLAEHLRSGKLRVKLFLRYPLHAKLYMIHRTDAVAPLVGFVGSSNLTAAGLQQNGELNVDVLEQDAANKLHDWFHKHWDDKHSYDITQKLAEIIEQSWACTKMVRPYLVYLKIVHHLSEDARVGAREFKLPRELQSRLLEFQISAVTLAARHLHAREMVLLGDVVGLGKTFMAIAVARIVQDDEGGGTLIICPPNLKSMWQQYVDEFELDARIVPISMVEKVLPELRRFRLLIIDESHNLRNRDGVRYQAIRDYIERNEPRCLLVTATPYNKEYADLSNQLRLSIDEKRDLGVRPEKFFQEVDEGDFTATHQASPRSLVAFEHSEHPDDWRDLMRLYMVRRTRRFIMDNYAEYDADRERHFVLFPDGTRSYFPRRQPRNLHFALDETDSADQYARLYRHDVVDVINGLHLPRYGLAQYLDKNQCTTATAAQQRIIQDLGRARHRLIGYCRTNLFKRLESSGESFLLSVNRHVLRNMVTLHAIKNSLPVPIGTQDAALLDTATSDADQATQQEVLDLAEQLDVEPDAQGRTDCGDIADFQARAADIYQQYRTTFQRRFKWLPASYFQPILAEHLAADARALCDVLSKAGQWNPQGDEKLAALERLLTEVHRADKVIVFTQFADTANYLARQLKHRGMGDVEAVTGSHSDPTTLSRRFSPCSNGYTLKPSEDEVRVLIATDVLSEGQNLQDAHIVVNYDLPWAIIRLVQRAGRVDRIGQAHDTIKVYSFLPADGVERIINLESRLRERLSQNNEVVGSDEQFFDEAYENKLRDIYTENDSALDDPDLEVDLTSTALQVWNSASEADREAALALPSMVHATRMWQQGDEGPPGILVYLRTEQGDDMLVRVDDQGRTVSQSLSTILAAAACGPDIEPVIRHPQHHEWVESAVHAALTDENLSGGALGPPRSVRRRVYERLKAYLGRSQPTLYATEKLGSALNTIFQYHLTSRARDTLSRQMRLGASDETLAEIVTTMYDDERLVVMDEPGDQSGEPQIVCSIGLKQQEEVPHDAD